MTVEGTINRFDFAAGQIVQEFGWDDDVDDDLRAAIEDVTGEELADEDYGDVADAVLIWWRQEDGDLTDMLVDALGFLEDGGAIWLLTPKAGRDGFVPHVEIEEAGTTAGLNAMMTFSVGSDWSATKLGNRGRGK
ncbi:MAG: DUF3052 domain-containing protein [Promicromonosporaceae bacterium]|nr:DUF3052 domain-containing protein [Promicromonosporaceae bacterium]